MNERTHPAPAAGSGTPRIVCKAVWKLFGPGADSILRTNPRPGRSDLNEAGLIGAVCDVNLEIHTGEIFVIMGLSGSGKSTLVRCMSRLIEPTSGQILFDGQDLLRATERELIEIRRHRMGMVFQHFALLPHLTVLGNVAFPLEVQGVERARREQRAMEMIELVGLKGRERYYPRELSGGQQQRVGIARSLAVEPDVWFLDEPFSALDPLIRREMQDEFLRLQSVLHKTIVFITHDFDEAIRLADRIAIMQDGYVVQTGTAEQLVLNPATDYVEEFTREIPRAKVLTAGAVMQPLGDGGDCVGRVTTDTRIEALAGQLVDSEKDVAVVDESGVAVGRLSRRAVIDVLVGRGSRQ